MVFNLMELQSIDGKKKEKKTAKQLKIIQFDMCCIHRCYVLGTVGTQSRVGEFLIRGSAILSHSNYTLQAGLTINLLFFPTSSTHCSPFPFAFLDLSHPLLSSLSPTTCRKYLHTYTHILSLPQSY